MFRQQPQTQTIELSISWLFESFVQPAEWMDDTLQGCHFGAGAQRPRGLQTRSQESVAFGEGLAGTSAGTIHGVANTRC